MTTRCTYDSGSMTGCRPLCDAPATRVVAYTLPCYGTLRAPVCDRHLSPTLGRIYPDAYTLEPVAGGDVASEQAAIRAAKDAAEQCGCGYTLTGHVHAATLEPVTA